ncbi:6035_t:CDS:2, partial [Acaulospora colombiana]
MDLMKALRPSWWFSAHLHVRFTAEYDHTGGGVSDWGKGKGDSSYDRSSGPTRPNVAKNTDEIVMDEEDEDNELPTTSSLPAAPSGPARNTDEIVMDDEDDEPIATTSTAQQTEETPNLDDVVAQPAVASSSGASSDPTLPSTTKFLALDKCLPRRRFLEIVDIPSPQSHFPPRLTFDMEWLAISKAMHHLLSTDRKHSVQPRISLAKDWVKTELEWVKKKITSMKSEKGEQGTSSEQGTDEDFELEISRPEVMLSHDWPEGIYNHGDIEYLLKTKPWFKDGINKSDLGNPHAMTLLKTVRPSWWFSAHMHVRFTAEYNHTSESTSEWGRGAPSQGPAGPSIVKNADEIVMDDEDEDELPKLESLSQQNKGNS